MVIHGKVEHGLLNTNKNNIVYITRVINWGQKCPRFVKGETAMGRKFSLLDLFDRLKIEALYMAKHTSQEIAIN